MDLGNLKLRKENIISCNSLIIGSGAAGLNCSLHLLDEGVERSEILILTDKLGGGTSFNTGSDKQTYYKLSILGEELDSPISMANELYQGGAMHGDIALVEATNSLREFFHLVQLGVPFPHDRFGGYVGYKTDNDPRQRATSIGPLTSREMCECLLKEVKGKNIPIHDGLFAIRILLDRTFEKSQAIGLLCVKLDELADYKDLENLLECIRIYQAQNIILATGGPAGIYKNSVYPLSQWGSTGLAIEAGAMLQNLTESQFGLASIDFRWNVSGSYQQVIPRYVSIDENDEENEFLEQYFPTFELLSKAIFLKGYQWPFNSERIEQHGSSLIDLAVYHETEDLNRRVYLDYTINPNGFDMNYLDLVAKTYLSRSDAMEDSPIKRLLKLNERAYQLYLSHNIDLKKDKLQIAVCNQHLNGGIACDLWWESISVKNLFAIGEVNGSHGIHRPGGSALNAGQVGGLRAAQKIGNFHVYSTTDSHKFEFIASNELKTLLSELLPLFNNNNSFDNKDLKIIGKKKQSLENYIDQMRNRMAKFGGIIRPYKGLEQELNHLFSTIIHLNSMVDIETNKNIIPYFKLKDSLLMQYFILNSIKEYHHSFGNSRGSCIIIRDTLNPLYEEKRVILPGKLQKYNFIQSNRNLSDQILTIQLKESKGDSKQPVSMTLGWNKVREIPKVSTWFENTWKDYENGKIYQ